MGRGEQAEGSIEYENNPPPVKKTGSCVAQDNLKLTMLPKMTFNS